MTSFNCLINRLINTPLSHDDYKKELSLIKTIQFNNGNSTNLIDRSVYQNVSLRADSIVNCCPIKLYLKFHMHLFKERVSSE